jgi:hypothetical protein
MRIASFSAACLDVRWADLRAEKDLERTSELGIQRLDQWCFESAGWCEAVS